MTEEATLRSIQGLPSLASRRVFLGQAAATAAGGALLTWSPSSDAAAGAGPVLAASPPPGFEPFRAPGRVVKVSKGNSLMPNGMFPKEGDARGMLLRAMKELTGKDSLQAAMSLFVHPKDRVCVKLNGIGSPNMSTNRELVLPVLEAMIKAGVPAENITVLEQWGSFLKSTRVDEASVPKGVKLSVHSNNDATMKSRKIPGVGRQTKFVRVLTESTCVINFALVKDHSICGITGALKNMTHGCITNPEEFHSNRASPHIALLAAQDVIKSRVRLNILDGFKVMANGGPLWKQPKYVIPHEAVYVSTDMVAADRIVWEMVERAREKFSLKTLAAEGRIPAFIQGAADLGVGIAAKDRIVFREVTI